MPKEDLAAWVCQYAQNNSDEHHRLLATLQVRCVADLERAFKSLEDSQTRNALAADRLSNRVFCLNIILTLATTVGAVATLVQVLRWP